MRLTVVPPPRTPRSRALDAEQRRGIIIYCVSSVCSPLQSRGPTTKRSKQLAPGRHCVWLSQLTCTQRGPGRKPGASLYTRKRLSLVDLHAALAALRALLRRGRLPELLQQVVGLHLRYQQVDRALALPARDGDLLRARPRTSTKIVRMNVDTSRLFRRSGVQGQSG